MVLIFFFPFFLIGVYIPSKRVRYYLHFFPQWASKVSLFLLGIKVKIKNQKIIDPLKQYIFVDNHRSYLDPLIAAVSNQNFKKYIGKAEVLKIPVLGFVLKSINVPVIREEKNSRKWSMKKMFEYLKDGASMVIFPEGTCNTTKNLLKEFKGGAFSLSQQTNIPIAIYTIIGAAELMPRSGLLVRPGKIEVVWNEVIYPTDFDHISFMKMKVQEEILAILKPIYPEGY
jgi:1-acyl-sn-glycerol-3-phosphate acyltransferase